MAFNASMDSSGTMQTSFNAGADAHAAFDEQNQLTSSFGEQNRLTSSFGDQAPLRASFESSQKMGASFGGETQIIHEGSSVVSNTVAGWNRQKDLVSKKDLIYIYTDYRQETVDGETKYIPGVKVGDGKAYLIDLPFTDALLVTHMNDMSMHVTAEERAFWNSKVRAYTAAEDDGNLILTQF